jgi:hypothetical protein
MHSRSLALCLLLATGTLGWSQARPVYDSQQQRGDVYAGFWYVSNDAGFTGTSVGANNGWKAGLDVNASKWFAVTGEFGMGFGQVTNASSTTYTFLIGPRVSLPLRKMARLTPYADALVGGTHASIGNSPDSLKSGSSFTTSLDGGIDYRFLKRISWRAQLGYLYSTKITHINDEVQNVPNPPAWHLELFSGPAFRF